MLIDVAISGDRNVIKKEAEKILKYKYLTIETHAVAQLVEALRYKSEGRGFDSR